MSGHRRATARAHVAQRENIARSQPPNWVEIRAILQNTAVNVTGFRHGVVQMPLPVQDTDFPRQNLRNEIGLTDFHMT